ncbi:MAG: hypothetical protein ABL977_06220 [Candidatus Eisenbacteria bacterium]
MFALGSCGPPRAIAAGDLHVRLRVPPGWEHLDHGRQQLFRLGERQISLTEREVPWDTLHTTAADSAAVMLAAALRWERHAGRYEIARRETRSMGGLEWTELETWSRLTHTQRRRVAYAWTGERLLILDMDRGDAGELGPAFEAMLSSIERTDPGAAR